MKLEEIKLTDFQLNVFLNRVNYLNEVFNNRNSITKNQEEFIRQNFLEILQFLPTLNTRTNFGEPFDRTVINRDINQDKSNRRLTNISQIKYPPENVAKHLSYNRANVPGVSTFYAGYGTFATTVETTPRRGDLITNSKWKLKEGKYLNYVAIFHLQSIQEKTDQFHEEWALFHDYLETLDLNLAKLIIEIYALITRVFTTKVNPNNKIEYLISALFADHFMYGEPNVDAVYYPSVPMNHITSNIALKPSILESHFELVEITENLSFGHIQGEVGGYMSIRTAKADMNSLENGDINWITSDRLCEENKSLIDEFDVRFD